MHVEAGVVEIHEAIKVYKDFTTCKKKKRAVYLNEFMTFDIETTSLEDRGFMYLWGACLGETVFIGRKWEQFFTLLKVVREYYNLSEKRMVIYCHNLPFEFQFMRNFFQWEDIFAIDERKPVTAVTGGFEFRCSYKLTNMSLAKFCEQSKSCVHYKKDGEEYDYKKIRYFDTPLNDYEYLYQYCDVKGLHESLEDLLIDDTLATIPITSTGYVRRDARKAMLSNPDNKLLIENTQLNEFLYMLMRTGRRGGDTHGLMCFVDEILSMVDSWDLKSSYPYVMLTKKFPMSPFIETTSYHPDDGRAYLMEIEYTNIKLKSPKHMPYIPASKCVVKEKWKNDNGRILTAKRIRTIVTDLDVKIIDDVYDYDEILYIHIYSSQYGMLPVEFRKCVAEYFQKKTDLEDGDPYFYGKIKNKINALFGMMLTDICQKSWEYQNSKWIERDDGVRTLLDRYYKSSNSFLAYQWGLWVTAHARYRLHEPTKKNLGYLFYSDTDSWKARQGYDRSVFEEINRRVIEEAETFDVKPYSMKNGKKVYLGVWKYEGCYSKFKTMGAKKYCYEEDGKLHVTVAGLSKKKSIPWLEQKGGIEAFKDGLVFPPPYSGRTFSVYHDVEEPYIEEHGGRKFLTGSSIAIHDTTYKLGKTGEYDTLLNVVKKYGLTNID